MQIRTRLQHTWATAVETVGTFLSQALKSSLGEADWLRFFALMGSVFAAKEDCPPVPNTPVHFRELTDEIQDIEARLNVRYALAMYQHAIQVVRKGKKSDHYHLLTLEPAKGMMTVRGFPRSQLVEASEEYLKAEAETAKTPGSEAVLVSVDAFTSLERAYPNYFLDTTVFLRELEQAVTSR
ncbi:hypothetical protein EZ313_21410 [Ramlibacter henchirensis]|uniref:Uncharacterized protein n=1 Tax=Ramlibacter henchirensis TaxID=204072 RepID=A0A4Z0BM07_9BURK|nr:hypothetical protein [Ramlibacter henchirensis]TFY99134.1 hypothetical protein EZ313_21410 [Ramlibacter henchirensis]